ncbi:PucR family transcriptional regulator [Nocardia sp. NPDC057663]|uniref:PucR family transcriptional regulator n=1 Tax=Nocardia sp. NPDC057663 TaxID=3346201 RepID=UPI0036725A25
MQWVPASPRVKELIRRGAEIALDAPAAWIEEVNRAVLAASPVMAEDPELAAASSRTTRANLQHWASANVRNPGAPVPANLGAEPLAIARDLVRRGLDQSSLDAYRIGQNVAWRRWMQIVFTLTDDPAELQELLDVTAQSISAFLDATMQGIEAQMQQERAELTRGSHAKRREVVALIMDGAPITRQRAEMLLGYGLNQAHTAAVVWSEQANVDPRRLDRVADAMCQSVDSRPLSIMASTATRWVWMPGQSRLDKGQLNDLVSTNPDIHIAVGPTAAGLDGFRRSHSDALTTQRMMGRLRSTQQIAEFEDVELVALVTESPERAMDFIHRALGDLASADPELRATVLTYLREQGNASAAAEQLYLHRNTLMRRLARARQLLPQPLERNPIRIAVALEILHWQGRAHGAEPAELPNEM